MMNYHNISQNLMFFFFSLSEGMVMLAHGQRSEVISLSAVNNMSVVSAHAIYLTSVESESPGGARLR